MLKSLTNTIAMTALVLAAPLSAQQSDVGSESLSGANLDQFAELMGGLFQSEPLTQEQEARLPAATAVVSVMMPEGFYAEMMGDVMDKVMRPMMSMFTSPDFILASRLTLDEPAIETLDETQKAELLNMLDPAWDRRVDAILGVLLGNMGDVFVTMEPPMREGLSKAYAVRFDEGQLDDIAAFFETPTGAVFARESMALFADPQVMSSSMQAMPQMMASFGNMETAMVEAMAVLPAERGYADLSMQERGRMAELLGIAPAELEQAVVPPKSNGADGAY